MTARQRGLQILFSLTAVISTWQLLVYCFELPNYILPSPHAVCLALYNYRDLLIQHTWPTLLETVLGLLFGILIGCTAAVVIAYQRLLAFFLLPILLISQTLPTFAIAPLLVIWFGYGIATKIVTAAIMIFFPISSAFYDGLRKVDPDLASLAHSMGASKLKAFLHVAVPCAFPRLASGIRIAAVTAPLGAVIGEWVGSSRGLGYLMLNANARMQIDLMYAALILLIVFALSLYFCIDLGLKKVIWW